MRPLLVIGLDATEGTHIDRLVAAGLMPNLAELIDTGATTAIDAQCMSTLPGAIWTDIGTGRSAESHGDYFPVKLHSGEATVREIDPRIHREDYYWVHAAKAGRRVIAVDQPLVPTFTPSADLVMVAEWQVHDQLWGRGSHPPELLGELEARHGRRPLDRCDSAHNQTASSYDAFAERVVRESKIKTDMAVDLMRREWDLFTIAYSDGHCAGHQMFHLEEYGTTSGPVSRVYRAVDEAVGRLVEAAPDEAGVIVFTSHGMGPYIGGPQLLPAVLRGLGLGDPRRLPDGLRRFVPKKTVQRLYRAAPLARRATERTGALSRSFSASVSAMAVNNNRVGAIRLNLEGREPDGVVTASDRDRLLSLIEKELLELRHVDTGDTIVDRVVRTDELYGPDRHVDLPDLLVAFRRDVGQLTSAVGPTVGTVSEPVHRPDYPRTGDHTDVSKMWARHPRLPAIEGEMRSIDIAPTVLDLLDVEAPTTMDGATRAS